MLDLDRYRGDRYDLEVDHTRTLYMRNGDFDVYAARMPVSPSQGELAAIRFAPDGVGSLPVRVEYALLLLLIDGCRMYTQIEE